MNERTGNGVENLVLFSIKAVQSPKLQDYEDLVNTTLNSERCRESQTIENSIHLEENDHEVESLLDNTDSQPLSR